MWPLRGEVFALTLLAVVTTASAPLVAQTDVFIDETLDSFGAAASRQRSIRELKEDLDASGESLGVEQNRFNHAVDDYNRRIGRFPMSLFAHLYGFHRKPLVDPLPSLPKGAQSGSP